MQNTFVFHLKWGACTFDRALACDGGGQVQGATNTMEKFSPLIGGACEVFILLIQNEISIILQKQLKIEVI